MPTATYSVQVAWAGNTTGVFTIGRSTIGGPDVLGGGFGVGPFSDVTADVKSISVTRGRSSDMAQFQPGTCTIKLKDPTGKYNPLNPASPLAGQVLPMRPVRVRATFGGTTYPVYYGFLSQIETNPDPAAQGTTLQATDLFDLLGATGAKPVIATLTNQTVSAIIGKLLDAIGWTDPMMRALAGGDTVPSWSADGTQNALQLIANLLLTDLGAFFVSAGGVATYIPRGTLNSARASLATLDGSLVGGMLASADVKSVINGQTVTRTGGVAQTATDAASRALNGYRDGNPITSPNLASDAQALNLAGWIVTANKVPRGLARDVALINRDAATFAQQLAREIADPVVVTEPRTGTSLTGLIQAINHEISDGSLVHRTRYTVQQRASSAVMFTIGVSAIGGTDVIGY